MTPDQARGLSSVLVSSGSFHLLRRPTASYIEIVWSGSQRQAAYFHEKVAEIQHFFPTTAQVSHTRPRTAAGSAQPPGLRFKVTSDRLRPLYNLFVPRGSRRISSACLELCGARAIAWLFSDHGRRTPRGFELQSVARHAEEAVLLAQWIKTILGVDCRARLRGRRLALLLDPDNAAKAAEQLLDYSPATRRHLFLQLLNDRDPVCDPSDLLLPGQQGAAGPARQAFAPMAQAPPLGA
jgi:hypothetical protein